MATALTIERCVHNEAIFRQANDGMAATAESVGLEKNIPFICECSHPSCRELVLLSLDEYHAAHARPEWFVVLPSHEIEHLDGVPLEQPIRREERYYVIEKLGQAGRLARRLNDTE
jgi:hypothetical protein